MALGATICKAQIGLADLDRHHYADLTLTIARHPSENDERMMQRVLCYALYAHERLEFTKGLSTDDEPDLWRRSLSGDIEHWIELGQPEVRRIAKACGRAHAVSVHCYSGHSAELWFEKIRPKLDRFSNLQIVNITPEASQSLARLAQRSMSLQVFIEDKQILISDDTHSVNITPEHWFASVSSSS